MRTLPLTILLATLTFALPAHARLGETEAQCIARYGSVIKQVTSTTTGTPLQMLAFSKNGFFIGAILMNGKVAFLEFRKADNSAISDDEINTLLDANSENQKWNSQGMTSGRLVWIRDDGAQAQYHPDSHYLSLATKSYVDAANAAPKAAEDNKLKGF